MTLVHLTLNIEHTACGGVMLSSQAYLTREQYKGDSIYPEGLPSGYEFCSACEEVVLKEHPHPDLLALKWAQV